MWNSSSFNPSRIVALLTDFGSKDHYVGVVKGRILSEVKKIYPLFVDLTHEIPPQDVKRGALYLKFSYNYFPSGTIFLAVVDPEVGTERKAILLISKNYFFVGPDNGIFSFILKNKEVRCYEIIKARVLRPPYSSTFQARDLFAISVAKLLNEEPIEEWTIPISKDQVKTLPFPEPEKIPGGYKLSIWLIDRFGNLITNFSKDLIKTPFEVWVNQKKVRLINTYAEGQDQEIIALFGSEGLLEIAIKNGSAYEVLGEPEIFVKT
ncbi:MAG: S-adenosyl-l-methionine hydroxide adenosyltransferase family protein [Caldimicrobium sp.]